MEFSLHTSCIFLKYGLAALIVDVILFLSLILKLYNVIEELKTNGVEVSMEIETYEYGKFAHIIDPNGLKIELWEPVDEVFTKLYKGKTNNLYEICWTILTLTKNVLLNL